MNGWSIVAIIVLIIAFLIYNSSRKVKNTFYAATYYAKTMILNSSDLIFNEWYGNKNNPRYSDFKEKGLSFVLSVESQEQKIAIIRHVMENIIVSCVQKEYKYMKRHEIIRMLEHNKAISRKFSQTIIEIYTILF